MSDTKLRLTYFTLIRGRGEVARLLFAFTKYPYEANDLDMITEWPAHKSGSKVLTVPQIEVDGEPYSQNIAINTYLARKFGLYGTTDLDCLKIEEIQNLKEELLMAEASIYFEKDEAVKKTKRKELVENLYPHYLPIFEKIIAKNGTGYAVGDKLTLADFVIFEGFTSLSQTDPSMLEKYPHVVSLRKMVANLGGIKEYLEKRPVQII